MPTETSPQHSTGWTEAAAKSWVEGDTRSQELSVPWQLAATVVAASRPDAATVLDVGSGSGSFLAYVLDALPGARGVWLDFSETMLDRARQNLAPLGDRVEYVLGDLLGLDEVGEPEGFDVVLSSRAAHHLGVPGIGQFYVQVAGRLAPDGWLANLDLCRVEEPWGSWLRDARATIHGPYPAAGNHPNERPRPTVDDHLAGIRAAGLQAPCEPWRSFTTALFMARKPAA